MAGRRHASAALKAAKEKGVRDMALKRGLKIEDMVRSRWVYRKLRNFRAGHRGRHLFLKRWMVAAPEGLAHFEGLRLAVVAYNQLFARLSRRRLTTARDSGPLDQDLAQARQDGTIMSINPASLEEQKSTNPAPAACGQPKTPAKHPVYGRQVSSCPWEWCS